MKLFCYKCGIIDVALVNGYDFGERLLEDIKFRVEVDGDKLVTKSLYNSTDKQYFETLNTEKWFAEANNYIQSLYEDGEPFECTKCFDFTVEVVEDNPVEKKEVKSSKVRIYTGKTLLSDFEAAGG